MAAVALDFLTQIINVHRGGGVFIAGDIDSNIYYLQLKENEPAWKNLGKLDFHKEDAEGFVTGRVAGSAYAVVEVKDPDGNVIGTTPVFVLVGGSGFTNETGIIMASKDGLNWERVFDFKKEGDSETYIGAGIFGVVWDNEAKIFSAGGHQVDLFFVDGLNAWEQQTDILFQSSDGYSWQEISRRKIRIDWTVGSEAPPYPKYDTGLLAAHCSTLVKDSNGNGVPDGNYGYDKSAELLIAPTSVIAIDYLFGIYLNNIPLESSSVTVTNFGESIPPSYPTDVEFPITCTATVGGQWIAAGGVIGNFDSGTGKSWAAILTASETVYIWKPIDPPGTNMIITMIGGMTGTNAGL